MRTWVKFCGITRPEDADEAVRIGANAVGFVQVPGSPRFISPERAAMIRARLPTSVAAVLLFSDAAAADVEQAIRHVHPDLLQFHGNESPAFCAGFGMPYLRAVPMASTSDVDRWARDFAGARALLLDSHATGGQGGSGRTFDWTAIPEGLARRAILAGGLGPANVGEAVTRVRPHGVDVSSGIESSPGVKDAGRMREFMEEVRRADAT